MMSNDDNRGAKMKDILSPIPPVLCLSAIYLSKWLKLTKIKSVIIYETEIWLNFYKICHEMDIKLCIVNARVQKDLHKKIFISKIYVEALKYCNLVLCKSDYEKEKYMDLGTVEPALMTIGNLKYAYKPDIKLDKVNIYVDLGNGDKKILNDYFLMASTHAPDELFHFEVIKRLKFLGINTVIAPRHINRSKEIFEFLVDLFLLTYLRTLKSNLLSIIRPKVKIYGLFIPKNYCFLFKKISVHKIL